MNSHASYLIPTDKLILGGRGARGTSVHIESVGNQHDIGFSDKVNFDKISTHSEGIQTDTIKSESGTDLIAYENSRVVFKVPTTLSNVDITGLTTAGIASQNYANQTLEHELDALTTAQNTILARTQGLTASKIMKSNGSGILAVSSITEGNVNTLSGNETVSGNKVHSGDITVNDLTASKLVLTDANKKLVSGVGLTDLFQLGEASNQFQGSGTNTVYSQTQSSDASTALNYLQMRQGSGENAKEMGLRMYGAEQAILFEDTIQLKDVGEGSYPGTNIGEIKNSGINLISGKTYQINGSQIASANLSDTANIVKLDTSENNFTGVVDASSFKQGNSALNFSHLAGGVADNQLTGNIPLLNDAENNFTGIVDAASFKQGNTALNFSHLAGSVSTGQIPDLASSKITSGTIDVGRIPDLASSKITSGTIADARLPNSLLRSDTAEQIINSGSTNGTIFRVRHSSNFQGAPQISVEDYSATGSLLQSGILTLDNDDVAIKNTDSDGGVVFYNNTSTLLGRLDNTGMDIKSGLTYKVNGTALATITTGAQTLQGVKTFADQPIFANGINASTSSILGASSGTHSHTIHGTVDLQATITQTAGKEANLRTTVVTGNLTQTGGNTSLTGDLTHTGGTVDITGDILLDGHMTVDTGHDIKILNDSVGVFSRVSTLEGNRHLLHILGSTTVNTSLVMSCKFWSLPMNSGYATNDMIMGQGHTNTPQTKKYSNHYQTVLDGTVGTDLTDFTKTQSSVSGVGYGVDIALVSSDWSAGGTTISNVIISGTGYINWAHSSFPSASRDKYNKLIRIGHHCDDAVKITIDGQAIVWAKYSFSNSISGTGNDNFNSVCVVRGDISALEIFYVGGTGGNYLTLQFNVMASWD
jgi:hypothetical protein